MVENTEADPYWYHLYGMPGSKVDSLQTNDNMSLDQPEMFSLSNYPNPFNLSTTIRISITENQHTQLTIYSITGEFVTTLVNTILDKGYHTFNWDGNNRNGRPVSSGIYIYELRTENQRLVKKMLLAK